ncbi:MAG: arginine repressor [Gemmatimonadota bacterium]
MTGTDRDARHRAIGQIVGSVAVPTQEELQARLAARGIRVSQSTLSRDVRELGLVKRTGPDGAATYALPSATASREARALGRLLPELLVGVEPAGQLIVVRTLIGAAQPVAAALDAAAWPEIAGTVAGDDTVLVVLRSLRSAADVSDRLRRLAGGR